MSVKSKNLLTLSSSSLNFGFDRGGAAVVADDQCHRHRIDSPGQIGAMRVGVERVALGSRGLDSHYQAHAIDHPVEMERPKPSPLKGAGRDGRRKVADREVTGLGGGT